MSIAHHISEIDQQEWDSLSGGVPFQSHRWAVYGERVLSNCQPSYITIPVDGRSAARGTFFLVRDEPLPLPFPVRGLVQAALHRWPLFLCRSPLAATSGLVLPGGSERETCRNRLVQAALEEAKRLKASFLLFDYIEADDLHAPGWPDGCIPFSIPGPGNWLPVEWDSFDAWLAAIGKKARQHYKRSIFEAQKLGIHVTRHRSVTDMKVALKLIRGVEHRHGSAVNPRVQGMLENMQMIESTFLEAHIGSRLVGCGMLVYDNGIQVATALGLARNVPYVYFSLVYEGLREGFEKKVRCMRWGSGANEVKHQLGFKPETNNHARVIPVQKFLRPLVRLAGPDKDAGGS